MMKHTQTIFAKYCGRAFSTIASSPMASSVRNSWREQKGLGLCVAFVGGWSSHILMNIYKRREHWYKVDRMMDECHKRSQELHTRSVQYHRAVMQEEMRANPISTTT